MENENQEPYIEEHLDFYTLGACIPLSSELEASKTYNGPTINKNLISLNRIMYKHYGGIDSLEVLKAISNVYRVVCNLKVNQSNIGELEELKSELKNDADLLYFVAKVLEVIPLHTFIMSEIEILKLNTPTTTRPENLMYSAERIILVHRFIIEEKIIEHINTGDFIKCFDLANKPLITPKVVYGAAAKYVCFLSTIEGMRASIAKSHFSYSEYDKTKYTIYDVKKIIAPHEKLYIRLNKILGNELTQNP